MSLSQFTKDRSSFPRPFSSFPRRRESIQPTVYLLASKYHGTLYIGVTADIVQRTAQHREDCFTGFTNRYTVHTLVWFEQHLEMQEAIKREKALKKWNRDRKIRLIEECNPQWLDLWPWICGQESMDPRLRGGDERR